MKNLSIAEILPLIREQVENGIWESEEEGIKEFKIMKERRLKWQR